ncbi:hypothetical protein Pan44_05870 [Caulifigura coniformis]|uniref:Uncharacterized protein n=1 Tax=Caulifigura coniformis TaxID=2527983 RepID=A0A517S8W8_9PLAN|nr:hypothetical protein [Caulifigura coniformis]QDT52575.1 hypothetical protein Pan44_05870 [Caulifigura coniformis]
MFSPGTLVQVPQFRGKILLVLGAEAQNTRCLWSSENGAMGEVLIPTSLLREVPSSDSVRTSDASRTGDTCRPGETLPGDWLRKAQTGASFDP